MSTQTPEHIFFTDELSARFQYEQALEVPYDNGQTLRQFCYYLSDTDEVVLNVETPYLVGIPKHQLLKFFKNYLAYPMPTRVEIPPVDQASDEQKAQLVEIQKNFLEAFKEVSALREGLIDDALFTQPVMALWMAKQQIKTYKINPNVPGIQVCYAIGNEFEEDTPENLVMLPEEEMVETLIKKGYRLPKKVIVSPFDSEALKAQGRQFLEYLQSQSKSYLTSYLNPLVEQCKAWEPDYTESTWRVLIFASRYTTVMRYAFENMAKAFEKIGLEVTFIMDTPYSQMTGTNVVEKLVEVKPHFTFNINHLNQEILHKKFFNVVWWQDLMPEIQKPDNPNMKRERALHYAFGDFIYRHVLQAGARSVEYQEQCANEEIYFPPEKEKHRRDAIVFVGSSYASEPDNFAKHYGKAATQAVMDDFKRLIYEETETESDRVAKINAYIESHEHKFHRFYLNRLWVYCNRREIIHTLIEKSPIPVELYGYGWQEDPITAPFYRGVVENGEPLAELYRSVKYGLSIQPFMIGHQRLAEIAFCEAIPLVLWTPNQYEHNDYKEEVVAFDTPDALIPLLAESPQVAKPKKIRQHFSYVNFAKRVIQCIQSELRKAGEIK